MTPDEQAELRQLSRRIDSDFAAISSWLDEYNMTRHAEARFVYFTRYLLGTGADIGLL